MLRYSIPPGYRRQQPAKRPKLDPWVGVDQEAPRERRLIPDPGYSGSGRGRKGSGADAPVRPPCIRSWQAKEEPIQRWVHHREGPCVYER